MSTHKFNINRGTWAFGAGENYLLDEEGRQCCLGFFLESCGVERARLLNRGTPVAVLGDIPETAHFLYTTRDRSSTSGTSLMCANDEHERHSTTGEREAHISDLFKSSGVEVTFTGEYPNDED